MNTPPPSYKSKLTPLTLITGGGGFIGFNIAKNLLDYGFHSPTVYFPINVPESIMIEPTETETKETLDFFIQTMLTIFKEIHEDPQVLLEAPHNTPNTRLDEALAARRPDLRWASI